MQLNVTQAEYFELYELNERANSDPTFFNEQVWHDGLRALFGNDVFDKLQNGTIINVVNDVTKRLIDVTI